MKPGWSIASRPPQGTFDGAPNIHTPSWAEHGPGGHFVLQGQVPNSGNLPLDTKRLSP